MWVFAACICDACDIPVVLWFWLGNFRVFLYSLSTPMLIRLLVYSLACLCLVASHFLFVVDGALLTIYVAMYWVLVFYIVYIIPPGCLFCCRFQVGFSIWVIHLNMNCSSLRMCGSFVVFVCSPSLSVDLIMEFHSIIRTFTAIALLGKILRFSRFHVFRLRKSMCIRYFRVSMCTILPSIFFPVRILFDRRVPEVYLVLLLFFAVRIPFFARCIFSCLLVITTS